LDAVSKDAMSRLKNELDFEEVIGKVRLLNPIV
jgi:hypothetical protein